MYRILKNCLLITCQPCLVSPVLFYETDQLWSGWLMSIEQYKIELLFSLHFEREHINMTQSSAIENRHFRRMTFTEGLHRLFYRGGRVRSPLSSLYGICHCHENVNVNVRLQSCLRTYVALKTRA